MATKATTTKKRKKVVSARTICRKVIDVPGINKRTGQLLKGWHYVNGKPVKVTAKPKKKTTAKKGLKRANVLLCRKSNLDGSTTSYSSHGGSKPCPYGGGLGKPKSKKATTSKQTAAQKKFAVNSAKARALVKSGKAKTLAAAWKMIK